MIVQKNENKTLFQPLLKKLHHFRIRRNSIRRDMIPKLEYKIIIFNNFVKTV